jgi:hypothetical protein
MAPLADAIAEVWVLVVVFSLMFFLDVPTTITLQIF